MNAFEIFEDQIRIIDSMVKAVNHIIHLVQDVDNLSSSVRITLKNILEFLSKAVHTIPRVLLLPNNHSIIKDEILEAFESVQISWDNILEDKTEFYNRWNEFCSKWELFLDLVKKSKENSKAFYLIMN